MGPRGAGGYNRLALLNLASKTDPSWVKTALSDLDELLLDHGFFCDQRESYQEAAATDAWDRVKALFAAELQGGA